MRRNIVFVLAGITVVVVAGIFLYMRWFGIRQERVLTGAASPNWPYRDFTIAELEKNAPQYLNVDVATTQTPEQTHAKFMEALRKEDFRAAAECCFKRGQWDEMEKNFKMVKDKGMLDLMVGDLSVIKQEMMLDTIATYTYSSIINCEKYAQKIRFEKDSRGVWLIKSL